MTSYPPLRLNVYFIQAIVCSIVSDMPVKYIKHGTYKRINSYNVDIALHT